MSWTMTCLPQVQEGGSCCERDSLGMPGTGLAFHNGEQGGRGGGAEMALCGYCLKLHLDASCKYLGQEQKSRSNVLLSQKSGCTGWSVLFACV